MYNSSDKAFTASIPTRFHLSPKFGENNENDQIGSPKLLKSKKPVVKRFMSPTISAASKAAAVPPKKILGERNSPIISGVYGRSIQSSCNSAYDTDGDGNEQNNFDADSALKKPYDPLTNYLSPRPRFLWYNPNRKRKIFLHQESERKDGAGVVSTSSSLESHKDVEKSTSEEGSVNEEMEKSEGVHNDTDADEDVESVESEEEIEELEEGKCWSLKGFLKFLLVLVSLFVFTTFTISMNSPNPLLIQEATWEFREQFLNQSDIHEVVAGKGYFTSEFEAMDGKEKESHISLLDVTQNVTDSEFVKEGISEDNGNGRGLLESNVGLSEGVEVQNEQSEEHIDEVEVSDPFQSSEATEFEVVTDLEVDDGQVKVSSDQILALEFGVDETVVDEGMEKIQGGFEQLQGTEAEENIESFLEDIISENVATIDLNAKNEQMKSEEEIKFQPEVVLAISFTIVAALGLIYHYSRQTNSGKEDQFPIEEGKQDNLPTEMQLDAEPEEATEIQNSKVICSVEEEKLKKVELFGSPSSPVHSQNVASEQFSRHSNAPIVELLGELVIGEEASSSFRSTKMRRKMLDPLQKNSNSISVPTTHMTISQSKVPLVQSQGDSSPLELLREDSPSRASLTTEKKRSVVKEESKGGEVNIATLTPVRRSSRIRNRAMSP